MLALRWSSFPWMPGDLSIVLVSESSRGDVGVSLVVLSLDAGDLSIVFVLAKTTLLVESRGIGLVKLLFEREESKNSSLSVRRTKRGIENLLSLEARNRKTPLSRSEESKNLLSLKGKTPLSLYDVRKHEGGVLCRTQNQSNTLTLSVVSKYYSVSRIR